MATSGKASPQKDKDTNHLSIQQLCVMYLMFIEKSGLWDQGRQVAYVDLEHLEGK